MRLQIRQVLNYFSELQNLSNEKMPISLAFKVDCLKQNLEEVVLQTNQIVEQIRIKFAKKNESGEVICPIDEEGRTLDGYVFNVEDIELINAETNKIFDEFVELPIFNLKISEFPEDFYISVDSVGKLRGLLTK